MLKLVNNNLIIRYTLPPDVITYTYPITPSGDKVVHEQLTPLYEHYGLDISQSFEEVKDTGAFKELALRNVAEIKSIHDGEIENIANPDHRHYVGKRVFVQTPLAGIKKHDFQPEYGIVRAIIKEKEIVAYMSEDQVVTPVKDFVELEAEFPQDVLDHIAQSTAAKRILNSWEEADKEQGDFYLEEVRTPLLSKFPQPIPQDVLKVSAIGPDVTAVKEGDYVMILPSYPYELKNIMRVDWDNKKIYFIRPESDILGIKEAA